LSDSCTNSTELSKEKDKNAVDKLSDDRPLPSISKLLNLARPEFPELSFACFLMVGSEATSLITPLVVANAYNTLVDPTVAQEEKMSSISWTMILVLIIHFAGVTTNFMQGCILGTVGERVVARLRNQLYTSILKQEMAFFDEHKTGELVSRLGSDTTLVQQATSNAVPRVILGIIKLGVSVGLMFWISAKLAGVAFASVMVLFCIALPFGKILGALSKAYQDVLGSAQTRSTEALGAMRTVQSFAAEDRESCRFREKVGNPADYKWWWPTDYKQHKTTYSVGFFKSIVGTGFFVMIFGVGFGAMYVCLWYGFSLVVNGEMSLGDLTAFQSYIFQIGFGLGEVSRYVTQVIEARGASGRIFQLLERIPAIPIPVEKDDKGEVINGPFSEAPKKPSSMKGDIEFRNVSFSYSSRKDVPVLHDFNLIVPANTTAALVGASGSGKSTVVSLLQRFYDANSGSITIDGNDIRTLDIKWLRRHIGSVQQEPQLFGMSVRENVCYGVDREVPDEEVIAACKEANAYDFIMNWPEGLSTMVGERGVKLSGGQKQRIAIARALLVNPRLLLLDEATSALDAESEHLVQDAIDKAIVGRTVIIVAHRLSTIKSAKQIVVLDGQKIVDVGSHDVLLGRCGKYQDLIKRQSVVRTGPIVDVE
jgi:ATP-binding cassette subfamily B protein